MRECQIMAETPGSASRSLGKDFVCTGSKAVTGSVLRLLRVQADVCCWCRWAPCPREHREPLWVPLPCAQFFTWVLVLPPAPAAGDSRREPPQPSQALRFRSVLCSAGDTELREGPSGGCAEQEPHAAAPAPGSDRLRGTSCELRAAAEAPGICASGGAGPILSWNCTL